MNYHLISASLLVAAAVFENVGLGVGSVLLVGAGVACETWFWMRLLRRRRAYSRIRHSA